MALPNPPSCFLASHHHRRRSNVSTHIFPAISAAVFLLMMLCRLCTGIKHLLKNLFAGETSSIRDLPQCWHAITPFHAEILKVWSRASNGSELTERGFLWAPKFCIALKELLLCDILVCSNNLNMIWGKSQGRYLICYNIEVGLHLKSI